MSPMLALVRFEWLRTRRGVRLRIAIGIALLLATVAAAAGIADGSGDGVASFESLPSALKNAFFTLVVFAVPFTLTTGTVSDEVTLRTLPYLFARPVGRTNVVISKFVVAGGLSVVVVCMAFVLACTASALGDAAHVSFKSAAMGTVALGLLCLYYTAVCLMWSTAFPGSAGIAAAIHLAFTEFGLGLLPGVLRLASGNHLAKNLAGLVPDSTASAPWWTGGLVIPVLVGLFLFASITSAQLREYRFGHT